MSTRNTRTTFTDSAGNNATKTHLSTNIIVKVGPYVVGAIQKLNISEKRSVKMVDELGTDGHIDSAPTKSTDIQGSVERIRFNGQRMLDAMARGFVHIHSQRIPFDIEIHDTFSNNDTTNAVITTIHNVWFTSLNYDYSADDWVIRDRVDWEAESISSIMANKNVVTGVANGQDGPLYMNAYEQAADKGLYRGSLDAAGVLNAFLTDPTV